MKTARGRRTGDQTRTAILRTAAHAFREQGYESATLEGIAETIGITRSAVLHYFPSKLHILQEAVTPLLDHIDTLLDRYEQWAPLSAARRRKFLGEWVEALHQERCVSSLLIGDVTAVTVLSASHDLDRRSRRFRHLLAGPDADPAERLRAHAAIGAVTRAIGATASDASLEGAELRAVIVETALATLRPTRRPAA
jgi:AcrR family transcriptional regulator